MSERYLVVGLGNPGFRYKKTRHNIGFMAIDQMISSNNSSLKTRAHLSDLCTITIANKKVLLAKPQTFMNRSGIAVLEIASEYKIKSDHILVIYDDVDLELGRIRLRGKGSSGGHNGLESIINELETQNFSRLRVGIGSEKAKKNMIKFVLSKFTRTERKQLIEILEFVNGAVISFIENGLDKTMNIYNTKAKPKSYQEE